jgi:hypothetical protein
MAWVKKNLFVVLGGLGALILLGLAGFYLFTQKQREGEVTSKLNSQIGEWETLNKRDPYPNTNNIALAAAQQKELSNLLEEYRRHFSPTASFTNMDSSSFKALLETTIFDLVKTAEDQGTRLPSKFNFTFRAHRASLAFEPAEVLPLAYQVAEIQALCDILFKARIHALVSLRRVPVSKKDTGSTEFLLGRKAATNTVAGAVLVPYEVTFQGFTAELGAALNGLSRSPHCWLVKNINVEKVAAVAAAEDEESPYAPYTPYSSYTSPGTPGQPGGAVSPGDLMMRRYGLRPGAGSRYGVGRPGERAGPTPPLGAPPVTPFPQPGVVAPVRRGPETVLNEKLLRITMLLDAVRLPSALK